ncbi:zinc finger protein 106, partial [Caerostris extrusa]
MSSKSNTAGLKTNVKVDKLVADAIKSLKKKRGSSSQAIQQHITAHKSNIDRSEIERYLESSHAKQILCSRINKMTGVKFYKLKSALKNSLKNTKKNKKITNEVNDKNNENSKETGEKTDVDCCQNDEPVIPVSNSKPKKLKLFCDICKVDISSQKNKKDHEKGKKHQKLLKKQKEKENKKKKLSENMNVIEKPESKNPSSNTTEDPCDSFKPENTDNFETNSDRYHRTRNYPKDFTNNHPNFSVPPSPFYHNNFRQPQQYNTRNCNNRNPNTNRWHSDSFMWNNQNRFPPFNEGCHRFNFNHNFNNPNNARNQQYYDARNQQYYDGHCKWNDFSDSNYVNFSENIQPPEVENVNTETPCDEAKNSESIKIPTTEELASSNENSSQMTCNEISKNCRPSLTRRNSTGIVTKISLNANSTSNNEKIKIPSENIVGKRIAHLINPLNLKDRAEVRRLVTEFSKNKKKENLIKLKLQTDNVLNNSSLDLNNVDGVNEIMSSTSITSEVQDNEMLAHIPSETNPSVAGNAESMVSSETKKRQRSVSFTDYFSDSTISTSHLDFLPPKSQIKKPCKRTTKILSSDSIRNSESPVSIKRKEIIELENRSSKKHKCSSIECLESCIESVVSQKDTIKDHVGLEFSEPEPIPSSAVCEDAISQNQVLSIKTELTDKCDTDTNQTASLSLSEIIQQQTQQITSFQDDATMSPVESLINLFASGNVTIKKEFDDPLIDAISTIDPALLNKVCENIQPDNNQTQEIETTVDKSSISASSTIVDNSSMPISNSPSIAGSIKNIASELQVISEEEEKIKSDIANADQNIQHYQALLDEWKTKKIKFQNEEEILRNKRNTLVKSMNDLVMQENQGTESSRPGTPGNLDKKIDTKNDDFHLNKNVKSSGSENTNIRNDPSVSLEQVTCTKTSKGNSEDKIFQVVDDEIAILHLPESKIPVIDIDMIDSNAKKNNDSSFKKSSTDVMLANLSELTAHNGVVNCLQVYENFVYTCASDNTAKRFDLEDPIFNAENAAKLRIYSFNSNVASMCRGRGKVYIGLRRGSIFFCDSKDQKELVFVSETIRCIDSTYQGGINLLVTLSTKGHVSIRDADRSGLLIKYVKAMTHIPLFMCVHNDWIYLSSAGYLSVLDISSGTFVKKYALPAAYTSLTVYKDHILTTSFSGFVRCYSKYDISKVNAYYGAGKIALTCIHAHDGW